MFKLILKNLGGNLAKFFERRRYFTIRELERLMDRCARKDIKHMKVGDIEIITEYKEEEKRNAF